MVEATSAIQPTPSRRSPANITAAAASATGMVPTISEAWLTVVRARPWNCIRNCNGIPKKDEMRMMRISLPVKAARFIRATGSIPRHANRKR